MNVKELFKGIALIIDDEIYEENSTIYPILTQIQCWNIPYLKYDKLPPCEIIENLKGISFVLLDWKLNSSISPSELLEGVNLPKRAQESDEDDNIAFLTQLKNECFCPIFIFTNENVDEIKTRLKQERLYSDKKCNVFLIKSKSDFQTKDSLSNELDKWLKENPSIYLLKEWDNAYQNAKTKLFIDFQRRSSYWPSILWKTYSEDGVNPSSELGDLLDRNIKSQITPMSLDSEVFNNSNIKYDKTEILECLSRQRFIDNSFLDPDTPNTGDVFNYNHSFFINIRPCCDLIERNRDCTADEVILYLLKCDSVKKQSSIGKRFCPHYGKFQDSEVSYIIYPICNKYMVEIKFKELSQKQWKEIKDKRIGCLLPPFLTNLQMKYSAYLQRQGLPRLPVELFETTEEKIDKQASDTEANSK